MLRCYDMSYSPSAVANTFLHLGRQSRQVIDPMKMQKLVYFAHGWHLGLNESPLISEPIEAWDYGPVVASLYRVLKPYGAGQILAPLEDFVPDPRDGFRVVNLAVEDQQTQQFMQRVLEVYGQRSALQLSEMTHRPDTPWTMIRNAYPGARGAVIPDSLMERYFKQLAQQNASRAVVPA
jgi:uncharacterized phage-associated protein